MPYGGQPISGSQNETETLPLSPDSVESPRYLGKFCATHFPSTFRMLTAFL